MKKDIFTTKPPAKKDMVIYEVNDNGRQYETDGRSYLKSFIAFLDSFGFHVKSKEASFSFLLKEICIDGIPFRINVDNASYWAKSAYDRKGHVRKPENRFIVLELLPGSERVFKIHPNKPIDAEFIKTRISKAIEKAKARQKALADYQQTGRDNTAAIALHYLANPMIKQAVKYIHIEKGIITFCIYDFFLIRVTAEDNVLINVRMYEVEVRNELSAYDLPHLIVSMAAQLKLTLTAILHTVPLPLELARWAADQHYQYFYTDTMSTEQHAPANR